VLLSGVPVVVSDEDVGSAGVSGFDEVDIAIAGDDVDVSSVLPRGEDSVVVMGVAGDLEGRFGLVGVGVIIDDADAVEG